MTRDLNRYDVDEGASLCGTTRLGAAAGLPRRPWTMRRMVAGVEDHDDNEEEQWIKECDVSMEDSDGLVADVMSAGACMFLQHTQEKYRGHHFVPLRMSRLWKANQRLKQYASKSWRISFLRLDLLARMDPSFLRQGLRPFSSFIKEVNPIRFLWLVSSFGCKFLRPGAFFSGPNCLDKPRPAAGPFHKRLSNRRGPGRCSA
ncbi:hypothetical protein EJB05_46790, partial [Eragrostis curvula]